MPVASQGARSRRYFLEKTEDFKEWMFTLQEAIAILQPQDPVGYPAFFMEGSARQWVMTLWHDIGRSSTWQHFRSRCVMRSNIKKRMNDNALLEQDKLAVWKIISALSAADVLQQGVWMT